MARRRKTIRRTTVGTGLAGARDLEKRHRKRVQEMQKKTGTVKSSKGSKKRALELQEEQGKKTDRARRAAKAVESVKKKVKKVLKDPGGTVTRSASRHRTLSKGAMSRGIQNLWKQK